MRAMPRGRRAATLASAGERDRALSAPRLRGPFQRPELVALRVEDIGGAERLPYHQLPAKKELGEGRAEDAGRAAAGHGLSQRSSHSWQEPASSRGRLRTRSFASSVGKRPKTGRLP
jgi:hypothetical protein